MSDELTLPKYQNIANESLLGAYGLKHLNQIHKLDETKFQSPVISSIIKACKKLKDDKLDFSLDTIYTVAKDYYNDITFPAIKDLYEAEYTFANIDEHIKILENDYVKHVVSRQLIEGVIVDSRKKGILDVTEFIGKIDRLKNILQNEQTETKHAISSKEWMDRHTKADELRKNDLRRKTTGYPSLDRIIERPMEPEDYMTVAGMTGSGKSLFTLNMIKKWVDMGICVLSINTEMGEFTNADRFIAMNGNIPIKQLISRKRDSVIEQKIKESKEYIATKKNLAYLSHESLSLNDIDKLIGQATETFIENGSMDPNNPYMIVTLDLFELLLDIPTKKNTEIAAAADGFFRILKKHKLSNMSYVSGVIVTQLNENIFREGNVKKTFKEPSDFDNFTFSIESIQGSSGISQRSRVVLTVSRPKYLKKKFFPELEDVIDLDDDLFLVNIAKNNHGGLGMDSMATDNKTLRIEPFRYTPKDVDNTEVESNSGQNIKKRVRV